MALLLLPLKAAAPPDAGVEPPLLFCGGAGVFWGGLLEVVV